MAAATVLYDLSANCSTALQPASHAKASHATASLRPGGSSSSSLPRHADAGGQQVAAYCPILYHIICTAPYCTIPYVLPHTVPHHMYCPILYHTICTAPYCTTPYVLPHTVPHHMYCPILYHTICTAPYCTTLYVLPHTVPHCMCCPILYRIICTSPCCTVMSGFKRNLGRRFCVLLPLGGPPALPPSCPTAPIPRFPT